MRITLSHRSRSWSGRRRGSTLVVVLALLALLSVLGLAFVSFAGSERTSAENYAAAAERRFAANPRPTTQLLTGFAARRILVGSRTDERNSALVGGRHTLLANLFGRDIHPHSGNGVNVVDAGMVSGQQPLGYPVVDQNFDTTPDSSALMEINDSPGANSGSLPSRPSPDVDYTAADINSVFLAYNGMALDPYNRPVHVIVPSFARPQYLRGFTNASNKATPILDWETRSNTLRHVLRPHPQHRDYPPTTNGPFGPNPRTSTLDPSGLRYVLNKFEANRLGLSGPFPFGQSEDSNINGTLDTGEDLNDNGMLDAEAHHGVWTLGRWQSGVYYRIGQWVLFSEDTNGNNSLDQGEDTIANNSLDRWYFRAETSGPSGNNPPNFAAASVGGTITNGGQTPIWRRFNQFQARYEFDADADGDGIKEAVWLDLDFPVQSLGNGRKAIPLFAFTVYDADGLINLNTAGNTSGKVNLAGNPFGGGQFISRSNLGVSPSEINPLWALDAGALASDFPATERTPSEVFQDHLSAFGHGPANYVETSNMEWWFLLKGRGVRQAGTGSIIAYAPGRHGDLNRLVTSLTNGSTNTATYPQPGSWGVDDNLNGDEGEQAPPFDINRMARQRPFVHPFDFRGSGTSTIKVANLFQPRMFVNGRNQFLQYQDYQAQQVPMAGVSIKWGQALSGALMQSSNTNALLDEQAESVVEVRNRQAADSLFLPEENFFLQASPSDIEAVGIESRLANLLAYNFKINTRSEKIRRRFTTDSWDTRDFARPFHGATSSIDRRRAWEYWATNATNRFGTPTYEFPPRFPGTPIANPQTPNTDPFRYSLRTLLRVVANQAPGHSTDSTLLQRRLSPNHLIDSVNGSVVNRMLTEHPLDPGTGIVPLAWTTTNRPAYPPTNNTEKEWWSRFDRQRLARDIYVLLYALCGGSDSIDYTLTNDHDDTLTAGNNSDRRYLTSQLREMAQFAVNLVDAMDSDNVITRFEYDKNLGPTTSPNSNQVIRNGWNLDDNPWTNDGFSPPNSGNDPDYPDDSFERGVVHGVEAQQLTIGEFFAVRTSQVTDPDANNAPYDHPATLHNDTLARVFAAIELRNTAPFDIPLSGGQWRIVVQPNTSSPAGGDVRRMTFRSNKSIEGGTRFSVLSCRDDQLALAGSYSLFSVDPDYSPGVTANPSLLTIAPRTLLAADTLDLCRDAGAAPQQSPFRISDGSGTDLTSSVGSLLTGAPFAPTVGLNVRVVLQRRMHPDRSTLDPLVAGAGQTATYDLDNPWIEMDRMTYTRTAAEWQFQIGKKDNNPAGQETHEIRKQLWGLRSRQRSQPFHRSSQAYMPNPDGAVGGTPWRTIARTSLRLNSLGEDNSNSPTQFDRWQAHFDRDFASLIDLFGVPVYGPHQVTDFADRIGTNLAGNFKFLRPDFPDTTNADVRFDNRWIRLLNFMEIPTRTDHFLASVLPNGRKYRTPGKINLNTIRHPEVLASLLDQIDALTTRPDLSNQHLQDLSGEASRDWWSQFIVSRDGYDPVSEFFLPFMAHGKPFRSLGLTRYGKTGIEHSLLRSIPLDGNSTSGGYVRRRLFQLGTQSQHNNKLLDNYTRHRLLAKIHGNTTTRSSIFFVFMQADWFEAHQDQSTGHVRIGARLAGASPQRSFFVIDRSRALELLQPDHIPGDGTYNIGSGSSVNITPLDPEALILYQQTLE